MALRALPAAWRCFERMRFVVFDAARARFIRRKYRLSSRYQARCMIPRAPCRASTKYLAQFHRAPCLDSYNPVMRAMELTRAGAGVLELSDREIPVVLPGDVLVRVRACGVCRTDLHIIDGEMPVANLPIIPGHEIVGVVEDVGDG